MALDESERNEKLREILDGAPNDPPIMFDIMTARDFMTWIVTLRKSDGTRLSASSFDGHRSGLFNIFRDFGFTMSKELESELKTHFKGLKSSVPVTWIINSQSLECHFARSVVRTHICM